MHLVRNTNYQQIRGYTINDSVKLSVRIRQFVAQPSDHRVDSGQGQGSGNDFVKGDARWQMIAAVLCWVLVQCSIDGSSKDTDRPSALRFISVVSTNLQSFMS